MIRSGDSHHLPVQGDDVANEGAVLHRCNVSVCHTVHLGGLGAAGPHGGATVQDEDQFVVQVPVKVWAADDRGDVW